MSLVTLRIDNVNPVVTGNLTTTVWEALSGSTTVSTQSANRTGVSICNTDSTNSIWVQLFNASSSLPMMATVAAATQIIPPLSDRQFAIGRGVAVALRSSAGVIAYTAQELK